MTLMAQNLRMLLMEMAKIMLMEKNLMEIMPIEKNLMEIMLIEKTTGQSAY